MIILVLSFLFAFLLGFSGHRTGICTVAAVGEVITSRTARTFASFLKVIVWVVLINAIAVTLNPELARAYTPPALSLSVLVGGFGFGVGAAINGGCSFATISKIAQGDLHMALTLPAFVAGALLYSSLPPVPFQLWTPPRYLVEFSTLPAIGLAAVALWGGFELIRLCRSLLTEGGYQSFVSKRYRLSSGAALIGISGGFLYLIHGRWAYSSRIMEYFGDSTGSETSGMMALYLFLALLAGAMVSALQNRQLKLSFANDKWRRNLLGGVIMGFGAMMVPGGNGKLILQDLPHLSLHAIAAYLAMVAGIAGLLIAQRRLFGVVEIVSCGGDECRIIKD